jgi:diguanylate cyclase (GGDEF)-like protein
MGCEAVPPSSLRDWPAANGDRLIDPLTGLGHRIDLPREIAARRDEDDVALLLVEVDGLRPINHALGYAIGDGLLQAVAARISAAVGPGDVVFRLGEGEFLVLSRGDDPEATQALGRRLLAAIDCPLTIGGHAVRARARVGISVGPAGEAIDTLLGRADAALLGTVPGSSQERVSVFDDGRHADTLRALQLSHELTGAAQRGELLLHYQPIVELATRRVVGREALVRWRHPRRGLISPETFIPLAEATGLIGDIGAWVLEDACREAAVWPGGDRSRPYVSVNVAVQQLRDPGFPARVAAVVAEARIPPGQLVIEVTERAVAEVDVVVPALEALRALGVRTFLDDFGTGYSSLGIIRALPLDGVKIDRSFVRDITTSDREWSLAIAIVRLLRELGLATTVEGVESAAQLAQLRSLGCSYGQGFYFGRPSATVTDA